MRVVYAECMNSKENVFKITSFMFNRIPAYDNRTVYHPRTTYDDRNVYYTRTIDYVKTVDNTKTTDYKKSIYNSRTSSNYYEATFNNTPFDNSTSIYVYDNNDNNHNNPDQTTLNCRIAFHTDPKTNNKTAAEHTRTSIYHNKNTNINCLVDWKTASTRNNFNFNYTTNN